MAEFRNIKVIIWDLDGVVVDTMPDIVNALRVAAREVGYGELTDEQARNQIGGGAVKAFRSMFGSAGERFVEPAVAHFKTYYPEHCADSSALYPGILEVFSHFAGKVKFAMATAKIRSATMLLLERLGVASSFDYIVTADDMQRMKPDPQSVKMVLDHFKVAPEQAVMIGDMKTDILAGRAAGVHTVGITSGYGKRADLEDAGPDALIGSGTELIDLITWEP